MDSFIYMNQNGKKFWGLPTIDWDALDKATGFDGTPIRTHDRVTQMEFEEDMKRTREQNLRILNEKSDLTWKRELIEEGPLSFTIFCTGILYRGGD